jgi:phage-related protein
LLEKIKPLEDTPPEKIIAVVFFKESSGNEPVRKWLKSLNKITRQVIGDDIKTAQYGWPLGMPLVRSLGKGLWEIRSTIPDGIARVIFKMISGEMVLFHGFIKKTRKTPTQDVDIALDRAKRY